MTPNTLKAPAPAINPADSTSYNFTTSMRVYDKVGSAHTVSLYFQRQAVAGATGPAVNNTWEVAYKVNNNPLQTVGPASFTADGKLTGPFVFNIPGGAANLPVPGQPNQFSDNGIDVDLGGTTQYSGSFTVARARVDGNPKGELVGVETADDGNIIAKYSNGQSQSVGRVRLYTFDNAQGLQPNGENNWAATTASGDAKPGFPGEGSSASCNRLRLKNPTPIPRPS